MEDNEFRSDGSGCNQLVISVIIPTCHRNDLLAKCLDCLTPGVQTLPPKQYEVIVTDDGSRSTAEQLVRENYPWVRWMEGPRRGPAANRNYGASMAHGEWLALTDDDCLPKPGWLQAYTDAISAGVYVYEGNTTCEAGLRPFIETAPINMSGGWLWSCNMVIQKAAFKKLGGFDDSFPHAHMEDVDFRERIKKSGLDFVFLPKAIIDHPPRKITWKNRTGAGMESEILFWYKSGNKTSAKCKLIINLVKGRLHEIKHNRFSVASVRALIFLTKEVVYALLRVHGWEKRYRKRYLSSETTTNQSGT